MSAQEFKAAYLKTYESGKLQEKIEAAFLMLENCSLCPRNCGVNRLKGETGFCLAGEFPKVSSSSPHFGEEGPLVGACGSGTIFLTHCNLGCVFCQNYSISHRGEGQEISSDRFSRVMVALQKLGCHNINFVSPTHYVPQILKALPSAIENGLSAPLVYNTGGYDSVETLKILRGVFDIYMPDFKYWNSHTAELLSKAADYPQKARLALKEMFDQVGDLIMDKNGIAQKGLLLRHLVLPESLAGTAEIMHFIATEISKNTYTNIMRQYYPCGSIPPGSPLQRRITHQEYLEAVELAKKEGITRLD
jgi:putative pyruvate formate lyase activating enzyme